ncbi:MAG: YlxR family protein [Corynebacterium sp.]|nr:YlxR family protein [Corynebacterium sp.]
MSRLRTCIATRKRLPESQLLRVVAGQDGKVIPDPRRRLAGRGAWITPTLAAYELAENRRAFARALRVSAPVDTGQVRDHIAMTYENCKEDRTLMSTQR